MDAVDHITRAFLRWGDRVAVEQPAFPPLLDLLDAVGVQLIGVEVDERGLVPDRVREAVAQGARALFFQPRVQNPTGCSLDTERAEELAGILADASDLLVVEDDSAGPLAGAAAVSLGRWLPARTLHIRSFSKSCGPDLRLAAVSGPTALLQQITNLRFLGQGWSSRLLQSVLVDLLTADEPQRQIAAARAEYARRRTALADALRSHGVPVQAADGLNLWVPVADETAALLHLAGHGIGAAAGSAFWIDAEPSPFIRVTAGLVREDAAGLAALLARAAIGVGATGPG
jgi:DNA-binding transcriptional MocR family regulator